MAKFLEEEYEPMKQQYKYFVKGGGKIDANKEEKTLHIHSYSQRFG